MAQLSPPFRIALVAMLGVVAVWFTVLRPKPVETTPAPTPTVATDGAGADTDAAAGSAASASQPPKTAARGSALAGIAEGDRSKPLVRALADDKVVVLLFWNKAGADDRAARRAVAAADRRAGKVVVRSADVRDVGRYAAITTGARVLASPTTLVIGRDRSARPIVGYTSTAELDDAVSDALAARR